MPTMDMAATIPETATINLVLLNLSEMRPTIGPARKNPRGRMVASASLSPFISSTFGIQVASVS